MYVSNSIVCVCVYRERPRSTTFSGYTSSPGVRHRGVEVEVTREPLATGPQSSGMRRAADLMGSGEFDRLEPLQSSPRSPRSPRRSRRRDLEQSTELRNRPTTPQSPLSVQVGGAMCTGAELTSDL